MQMNNQTKIIDRLFSLAVNGPVVAVRPAMPTQWDVTPQQREITFEVITRYEMRGSYLMASPVNWSGESVDWHKCQSNDVTQGPLLSVEDMESRIESGEMIVINHV